MKRKMNDVIEAVDNSITEIISDVSAISGYFNEAVESIKTDNPEWAEELLSDAVNEHLWSLQDSVGRMMHSTLPSLIEKVDARLAKKYPKN